MSLRRELRKKRTDELFQDRLSLRIPDERLGKVGFNRSGSIPARRKAKKKNR
jgi:hypothetical protein